MLPRYTKLDKESLALVESLIPISATNFVNLIGLESAIGLFNEFGGTSYRFVREESAKASERFEELAIIIGRENATILGREFNGDEVYIPRCRRALSALRARMIVTDFDEITRTQSAREACNQLARRYRVSYRWVEIVVNGKTAGAV